MTSFITTMYVLPISGTLIKSWSLDDISSPLKSDEAPAKNQSTTLLLTTLWLEAYHSRHTETHGRRGNSSQDMPTKAPVAISCANLLKPLWEVAVFEKLLSFLTEKISMSGLPSTVRLTSPYGPQRSYRRCILINAEQLSISTTKSIFSTAR